MKWCFLVTLAVTVSLGGTPAQDDPTSDRNNIQGTWCIVTAERHGKPVAEDRGATLTFAASTVTFSHIGDLPVTYELDPTRQPKHITLRFTLTGGWFGQGREVVIQGIYRLEGDTLTICVGGEGPRPTEFTSPPGSGRTLSVCRRQPPRDGKAPQK